MSIKETKALLKMILKQQPLMVFVLFLCSMLRILPSYLNVLMTSKLINYIVSEQYASIQYTLIIIMSLNLVLSILRSGLESIFNSQREIFEMNNDLKIIVKNCDIDYAILEKTSTQRDLQEAREGLMYSGGVSLALEDLMKMLSSLITIVLSVITLLMIPATLLFTFSLLFFFVLIFIGNLYFLKKSSLARYEFQKAQFRINQEFNYYTELPEKRSIGKDIRIYHLEKMIENKIRAFFLQSEKAVKAFDDYNAYVLGINDFISQVLIGAILIIVLVLVKMSIISVGYVAQYVGLIQQINYAFRELVLNYVNVAEKNKYLTTYTKYLSINNVSEGNRSLESDKQEEHLFEFKDVYFKYPNSDHYILKGLSLKLSFNQRTALVGLNGAGKTTIVKLLCRFYQASKGEILLDGAPIDSYTEEAYGQLLSCVFQDYQLLAFSIKENIAPDSQSFVDQSKIEEILSEIGLWDKVRQTEQMLDTMLYKDIEDGVIFSGGEMQKLAIARALYKKAEYLILDEPTAALDPFSEAEVFENFKNMTAARGALFISHRLSSCKFSDKIYVIEDGKVVEEGNHDDLISQKKVYYNLWNLQSSQYS